MMSPSDRPALAFDSPAIYQIAVQGKIEPAWSDRLEGMSVRQIALETGSTVTTLEGRLSDQAALAGVLNTLYELHMPVVSVTRLDV